MRLYEDLKGKGTYATAANAEKKLRSVVGEEIDKMRYMIGVTGEGRYIPIVIPTRDQQWMSGPLAHAGICVTF